jgi:transcriptional regulator with XRE-family HTH domain
MMSNRFGATIRRERDRLKWSQNLLAKRLNVSPALIARMEKGDTLPSRETLLGIAREMILDPVELFSLVDQDKAQKRPGRELAVAAMRVKAPSAVQLVGRELFDDKTLKATADLMNKLMSNTKCKGLVNEVLRVFAKEAEDEGSFLTPKSVSEVDDLPKQAEDAAERIINDAELRTSYQQLKTCLSNPKVRDTVVQILQTFLRAYGRD